MREDITLHMKKREDFRQDTLKAWAAYKWPLAKFDTYNSFIHKKCGEYLA